MKNVTCYMHRITMKCGPFNVNIIKKNVFVFAGAGKHVFDLFKVCVYIDSNTAYCWDTRQKRSTLPDTPTTISHDTYIRL